MGILVDAIEVLRLSPQVPPREALILTLIDPDEGAEQRVLQQMSGITSAGFTVLLDRLEVAGYIVRVPIDRRSNRIELTDSGILIRSRMVWA